jgi:hypothetical protein
MSVSGDHRGGKAARFLAAVVAVLAAPQEIVRP